MIMGHSSTQSHKTFSELLDNKSGADPGQIQREARNQFGSRVAGSHFKKRVGGDLIPVDRTAVIIGIATYSQPELQLLDRVEEEACQWKDRIEIAVFDLGEVSNMPDVNRFVPPVEYAAQSPIISVWQMGKSVGTAVGLSAAKALLLKYGAIRSTA